MVKPWEEVIDKLKKRLRVLFGYKDLYDSPAAGEKYVYFALHSEPEAYPMLLAPFYTDQLWAIKQVARSLPLSYKLYVKDHPGMTGFRPRSYYKEIKKIPNVRLIDSAVSGLSLIKGAELLVTISGTSGWEAVLLKKPAIIFGDIFYSQLSSVKKCVAIEDLPYLIKDQLDNFSYNEPELANFIAAVYKEGVDVDLVRMWDVEGGGKLDKGQGGLLSLAGLIANKLNLKRI